MPRVFIPTRIAAALASSALDWSALNGIVGTDAYKTTVSLCPVTPVSIVRTGRASIVGAFDRFRANSASVTPRAVM